MNKTRIAIVDYGVGNLYNLMRALRSFGAEVVISEEADVIKNADAIVLPGVGAFATGMRGLEVRGLVPILKEAAAAGKPMLGICLGAQLLLTEGHEFGTHSGLGLIPGSVIPLAPSKPDIKIPQIGWNTLTPVESQTWAGTILEKNIPTDSFYFVHSYVMHPDRSEHVLATTEYGGETFASVIRSGTVYGCQFHPEKSGTVGLRLLESFLHITKPT